MKKTLLVSLIVLLLLAGCKSDDNTQVAGFIIQDMLKYYNQKYSDSATAKATTVDDNYITIDVGNALIRRDRKTYETTDNRQSYDIAVAMAEEWLPKTLGTDVVCSQAFYDGAAWSDGWYSAYFGSDIKSYAKYVRLTCNDRIRIVSDDISEAAALANEVLPVLGDSSLEIEAMRIMDRSANSKQLCYLLKVLPDGSYKTSTYAHSEILPGVLLSSNSVDAPNIDKNDTELVKIELSWLPEVKATYPTDYSPYEMLLKKFGDIILENTSKSPIYVITSKGETSNVVEVPAGAEFKDKIESTCRVFILVKE